MKDVYFQTFDSEVGRICLAETDRGLARIQFGKVSQKKFVSSLRHDFPGCDIKPGGKENKKAEKQITGFLNGKLKKFN